MSLTMISPSSAFGMSLTDIFLMATVSPVVQFKASAKERRNSFGSAKA